MILRAIDPMKHHSLSTSRANESIASRTGAALSVGAQALGSLALGALAVGALARRLRFRLALAQLPLVA